MLRRLISVEQLFKLKSTLAIKLAKAVTFSKFYMYKDLCYSKEDVVTALSTRKKKIIIGDEIVQTAFNRDFFSEYNKILIKTLTMYRDSGNLFISCIPMFSQLDNQFRSLIKMRIDVVKRGVGIVHIPIRSQYTRDIWDTSNNEKIEREWIQKGYMANPKYSKLSTFMGIIKFGDLTPKSREKYLRIKAKKRNAIYEQEIEKKEEPSLGGLSGNPLQILQQELVNGSFYDRKEFDTRCKELGLVPTSAERAVRKLLRNELLDAKPTIYFREYNQKEEGVVDEEKAKKDKIELKKLKEMGII